jgi:hypothetical protein
MHIFADNFQEVDVNFELLMDSTHTTHQISCWRLFVVTLLFMLHKISSVHGLQPLRSINARRGATQMKKLEQRIYYPVLSPSELRELAERSLVQTPGSNQYGKKWRYWSELCITSIRHHLSEALPCPPDPEGFDQLFYELGAAADRGEMPSFADAGSRSGYALEFFCRARLLADLIFNTSGSSLFWEGALCEKYLLAGQESETAVNGGLERPSRNCRITSLGGGPGYDHLSVLLADTYRTAANRNTRIETIVFDYEEGWGDLVESMNVATNKALENGNLSCVHWGGGCDITKPLSAPINAACQAEVSTTDIFICQYTVAENAKPLRESDFVFFSEMFETAKDKTIFIFTETTPRVWPDFADLLIRKFDGGAGFQICFPRNTKRGKTGPQLVIQKCRDATLSRDELERCDQYRQFQAIHEEKLRNGFQRQPKKIKGNKVAMQPLGG